MRSRIFYGKIHTGERITDEKKCCQNVVERRQLSIAMFCPNTGGVETHIYHLAKELMKIGHHVIVLTHAYGPRRGVIHLKTGLKVYYLPVAVFQNCYLASGPGSLFWFRKIFLCERIDIVHCHSSFSTMAHEALLHAWILELRTVFTDHSLFGFSDFQAILMNKLLLRYSLPTANRFICVSHVSKENTVLRAALHPDRVFVIPNAIETVLFKPDPQKFLTTNDSKHFTTTVVVMSRLVYRKGADLLVDVIANVCLHRPHIRFIVGGDGPKRIALEEMRERYNLHSRVIMLGTVPHDQVRDVLVQGQIFLNTSLTEAFCMAIVEAASCGLFVVSTNVGGIPEVLPPEFMALADPNIQDLEKTLLSVIDRRENGELTYCPLARHYAIKKMYNWRDVAQRTERVYLDTMSDTRVPFGDRLRRYFSSGAWFSLVWILLAIIDKLLLLIFDWMDPREIENGNIDKHSLSDRNTKNE